jgi:hypothetical protein
VKNSPINIRDALYGGRTEAAKMWYKAKQGEEIHYVDVISLYRLKISKEFPRNVNA